MPKDQKGAISPPRLISASIREIRGQRVILDADLAAMYGVATKALTRAVRRNLNRFPGDFMFQLSSVEIESLRRQFGASKGRGGRRYLPYAFTEQGIAMLSSVLSNDRAVEVNITIMRAFVQLRHTAGHNHILVAKFAQLEAKLESHDEAITELFRTIQQMLASPDPPHHRKIGFNRQSEEEERP